MLMTAYQYLHDAFLIHNSLPHRGRATVQECKDRALSTFCSIFHGMQDLYANSQQSAAGIQDMLETALNEGRAVGNNVHATGEAQEGEQELTVEQLSNAAMLASAILASHGPAEVTKASLICFFHHLGMSCVKTLQFSIDVSDVSGISCVNKLIYQQTFSTDKHFTLSVTSHTLGEMEC